MACASSRSHHLPPHPLVVGGPVASLVSLRLLSVHSPPRPRSRHPHRPHSRGCLATSPSESISVGLIFFSQLKEAKNELYSDRWFNAKPSKVECCQLPHSKQTSAKNIPQLSFSRDLSCTQTTRSYLLAFVVTHQIILDCGNVTSEKMNIKSSLARIRT